MKTKPAKPVAQSFPTCGEVFYFWASRLELLTWSEAFAPANTKARAEKQIRNTSDLLRDWANEASGRVPEKTDFERTIREHTHCSTLTDPLIFVLTSLWADTLSDHCATVRKNTTYLGRGGTRSWYTRWQSCSGIITLYRFQKLLCHLHHVPKAFLNQPLDGLLAKAWNAGEVNFPLTAFCFKHYAELIGAESDPKSLKEWRAGKVRPAFAKIGDLFRGQERLPEIVCAFGFARALETLARLVRQESDVEDWAVLESMLLRQAGCLLSLDDHFDKVETATAKLSLIDFDHCLSRTLNRMHHGMIAKALNGGSDDLLDIRFAGYRVFKEHFDFLAKFAVPEWFPEFIKYFDKLWRSSQLDNETFSAAQLWDALTWLREKWRQHIGPFEGPMLAIEARIVLREDPLDDAACNSALALYQRAADHCRYRAGVYSKRVYQEALGLAALLQRARAANRPLKPWIKNSEAWFVLIGFAEAQTLPLDRHLEILAGGFQIYARGRLGLPGNFAEWMKRAERN